MIKVGNDFLAAVLYEKEVIKSLRVGDVGGVFLNTFYRKNKKGKKVYAKGSVKKILKTKKLSELVIHLAPFDSSHKYPVAKLKKQIMADTKWCQSMQVKFPDTKIYISFFCEHNHSAATMRPLFDEGKSLAPSCAFINSIWLGEEVEGVPTEIHFASERKLPKIPKNPFTISFDGFGGDKNDPKRVDMPDAKLVEILKPYLATGRVIHVRAWNFRHNGKKSHLDETPIGARKYFPSVGYLLSHIVTLEGAINPEPGKWDSKRLLKTFADDHGNDLSQSKDCRIMCILPGYKKSTVDVFDSQGHKIDTWKDLGLPPHTNTPKGKRLYSSLYMHEVAWRAFVATGSYLIVVGTNKPVDVRLRNGYFKS